ncbi:SRPBCC family protein [Arthrobacter glacialis]|uniref:SRPBCC family protein n=1 Tax=Arthrobacter glacialis TaxID=1664 RepID=A0A2S3ZYE0_ARTGL|nr:SRPBCC family protein [Arthrobacter glacialis]POH74228.1 SRPBCC family protein [Arthrobacter glacialis]
MEYTQDIIVNVPRQRFIELFDNVENMQQWMDGLLSFEPLTGVPGQAGATSKLTFKRGRGTMEMVETIVRRELPDHFDANYDAKGVHNICENQFIELDGTATKWVAHNIFEMKGFMKVVGVLFGSSFPKESYKSMEAFKAFAEANA